MLKDKDTPPIFTSPKLREECPPIKPAKHFVYGWRCESIMYGCHLTTMRRHSGLIITYATRIESYKLDEDGHPLEVVIGAVAPRIEVNRLPEGTRATRSRIQDAHMAGIGTFLKIHSRYITDQKELDAFKAFDEAPDPTDHHAHEPREADAWGESTGLQHI